MNIVRPHNGSSITIASKVMVLQWLTNHLAHQRKQKNKQPLRLASLICVSTTISPYVLIISIKPYIKGFIAVNDHYKQPYP